jgi:gluconate:H+ symporter, GntP family
MDPLWLLLIGIVVVVGGIMGLRLHAFLALLLASLVVGALTPDAALERHAQERRIWVISRMSGMTAGETFKTFSFMPCVMGIVGLLVVLLLATWFPMT